VYGGEYLVHGRNGFIENINGNYIPVSINSIIPAISEMEALSFALNNINAESYKWQFPENEDFIKKEKIINKLLISLKGN